VRCGEQATLPETKARKAFAWGYDDARPSPVRHLAECGDKTCGTHRLYQPEVRPKFHAFCLRRLAVAVDEEHAFPGASGPSLSLSLSPLSITRGSGSSGEK
jgi:hypothetical protein